MGFKVSQASSFGLLLASMWSQRFARSPVGALRDDKPYHTCAFFYDLPRWAHWLAQASQEYESTVGIGRHSCP